MINTNIKYFKEDFLRSEKFKKKRDLLNVILKDEQQYSKSDVEKMIKKYFEEEI